MTATSSSSATFCPGSVRLSFVASIIVTLTLLIAFTAQKRSASKRSLPELLHGAHGNMALPKAAQPLSHCRFPVIYNKPSKTGSTSIRDTLYAWAVANNRDIYNCPGRIGDDQLFESCLPKKPDRCGVMGFHFLLTPERYRHLRWYFPNYRLVSSTRHPETRVVSDYFMKRKSGMRTGSVFNETDFRYFLNSQYNQWYMFWYHTGYIPKPLPSPGNLTDDIRATVDAFSRRYDAVIDLSLKTASNVALRRHDLFQLVAHHRRNRNTHLATMSDDTRQLLRNVSYVEEFIHNTMLRRLAETYDAAPYGKCASFDSTDDLTTCLAAADHDGHPGDDRLEDEGRE